MPQYLFASCTLLSLLLVASASTPVGPTIPSTLVPAGQHAVDRVAARGVQVYQCRGIAGTTQDTHWVFVAPDAQLFDAEGRHAGTHYAGPHWEAPDGSKIFGIVKAREDAPREGAIPWLLLSAHSFGGEGRFAKVASVQRLNTSGGVAPARACDVTSIGAIERVPYTADYVLYSMSQPAA